MPKNPLSERLKTGELYFVFTGIDFDTGDFWMLSYGDGSPEQRTEDTRTARSRKIGKAIQD